MNLVGTGALVAAAVLVLVGVLGGSLAQAALPRGTSRRARAGWLSLRVLVTLLSSALVVAGVAAEMNRRNGWYGSLDDVLQTADAGPDLAPVHAEHKLRAPDAPLPPLPSPGRLQHYRVASADGTLSNPVDVLLPDGYQDAGNAQRRYPVLVLGHGMPGSPGQWLGPIDIRKGLDPLVASGRVSATIVVIPALMTPQHTDTECVAGPGGPHQMEDWLAHDVPDFVLGHFRARQEAGAWATMGFSAGGWCAAMLTTLHPTRFGAAISLGGYFRPQWEGSAPSAAGSPQAKRLDLVALAGHQPPAVAVYAQSSEQDDESRPSTAAFARAARPPLAVTLVMDRSGGHRTAIWAAHLPAALQWLAAQRPAFAGTAR